MSLQAINAFTNHLESVCAKNPEANAFCKTFGDVLEGFPEKAGKQMQSGLHSLNHAAELIVQDHNFSSSLEAQGAVMFLAKVVGLWKKLNAFITKQK